jgi:hypothetical protein
MPPAPTSITRCDVARRRYNMKAPEELPAEQHKEFAATKVKFVQVRSFVCLRAG